MTLPRKWKPAQLEQAVKESKSLSDVLRKLNLRPSGGNHTTIKNWIVKLKLDNSHFDPYAGMVDRWKLIRSGTINPETVFIANSRFGRGTVKRFAREHVPNNRCAVCDCEPMWNNKPLVFQLDHINGISSDHRKENLRWLCPNCHTQTPGYAGRSSYKKIKKSTLNPDWRHAPNLKLRKVVRPPKEELQLLIEKYNWCELGRQFGVSDNAIRKWAKQYKLI